MLLEPAKINNDTISKEQIESLEKKQNEYKLIGKMRKIPGHTLFSFNYKTGEIKEADVAKCNILSFATRGPVNSDRINIEPDCYYEQALNRKNFIKRLVRRGILARKEG